MSAPLFDTVVALPFVGVDTVTITNPATVNAGDLLMLVGDYYDNNTVGAALVGTPTGFTQMHAPLSVGSTIDMFSLRRIATAAEGGLTTTLTFDRLVTGVLHLQRVSNWIGTAAGIIIVPLAFEDTSSSDTEINPPPITHGLALTDAHGIFTFAGGGRTGDALGAGRPAGYTTVGTQSGPDAGGRDTNLASGYKDVTLATETPGLYQPGAFNAKIAGTVVIQGVSTAPAVTFDQAEIVPGGTISGSYVRWTGGSAPTILEGIRGANSIGTVTGEITAFTVTGDGVSGTFTGTIADLPASASAQYLRFSDTGVVDVTWRLS